VKTGCVTRPSGKGLADWLALLAGEEHKPMLNRIVLWQARFVGWARDCVAGKDDAGASLVEYALLLALIAVVAIGALSLLGGAVTNSIHNVTNGINGSTPTTS
jgi:pilus assembly protein Flp/PilA